MVKNKFVLLVNNVEQNYRSHGNGKLLSDDRVLYIPSRNPHFRLFLSYFVHRALTHSPQMETLLGNKYIPRRMSPTMTDGSRERMCIGAERHLGPRNPKGMEICGKSQSN